MRTPTGLVAHSLLGGLTLLSAGAIVLSLLTAPPVAQQQLQQAAKDTAAAPSFVLTDVNVIRTSTPSPALGGKSSEEDVVRIEYQSPDRLLDEVTSSPGHTITLLVVGDRRYEKADTGLWTPLPPSAASGTSNGTAAAKEVLLPLRSLGGATSVVLSGSTFRFLSGNEPSLLETLFGQSASELSAVRFSAQLNGNREYVAWEQVLADQGSAVYEVRFGFSSVGTAPAIEIPPASQTTGA